MWESRTEEYISFGITYKRTELYIPYSQLNEYRFKEILYLRPR